MDLLLVKYILNLYLTFSIPDVGWEDYIVTNYNAVLSLMNKSIQLRLESIKALKFNQKHFSKQLKIY